MVDSIINTKNLDEGDVVFLSVPYEKTASSRKGTVDGPGAVIEMLDSKLELFDRTYKMEPSSKIKITTENLEVESLSPEECVKAVEDKCEKVLNKNKFIFLLGGEHSVSLGYLKALSKKIDPKEVTLLQLDAHCDLRDSDADYNEHPSHLAHSCIMRRSHELGYNLVQVGIRTYSKSEYEYFSDPKNNIKTFEWTGKKNTSIDEVLGAIKTKYVYITIDVDGFDPSVMPGTGTAVQGGIDWWYGVELLERVIDEKELVGADIVEVSPMQDSILTEYGAAQLAYTMIARKFQSNLKR